MKTHRIDEYHKHGCNFFGKLVVVDYSDDMRQDPQWGNFNANLTYDYLAKARALVLEQYEVESELLAIPELVVRIK